MTSVIKVRWIYLAIPLLAAFAKPLWAGTEVKARLESSFYKEARVDVIAAIGDGHLRFDFQGPWSHGSLIYERDSALLTVVDHLHKTVLPLTQDSQTFLKMMGAGASPKLRAKISGSGDGARVAFELASENARAFFNGAPALRDKGIRKEGFTCDGYRTDLGGKKAREVWVTVPQSAGMGTEDYDTLRSM